MGQKEKVFRMYVEICSFILKQQVYMFGICLFLKRFVSSAPVRFLKIRGTMPNDQMCFLLYTVVSGGGTLRPFVHKAGRCVVII